MAQTHKVDIKNMKFNPASIAIAKGDTVLWTNIANMEHTVTGDDPAMLGDSGNITKNGGMYSHVFDTSGTISYHCEIHPTMTGTVIVA